MHSVDVKQTLAGHRPLIMMIVAAAVLICIRLCNTLTHMCSNKHPARRLFMIAGNSAVSPPHLFWNPEPLSQTALLLLTGQACFDAFRC